MPAATAAAPTVAHLPVWRRTFGQTEGFLACLSLRNGVDPHEEFYAYPDEASVALRWLAAEDQARRDAYCGARLFSGRKRQKTDTTPVTALYEDLDGAPLPTGDLAPSVVLKTSPDRYHCWWRLTGAIEAERAQKLNARLAAAIGADASGTDLSQVLRIVGTHNWKPKRDRPLVSLLTTDGPTYDPDALEALLPVLPAPRLVTGPVTDAATGDRPGDDFNVRATWAEILEPAGWPFLYQHDGVGYWCRPGKDGGTSATTGYEGTNLFHMFSSSTEFEANANYTKFAAYTVLNYGGDFSAAAKALAAKGYGKQHKQHRNGATPTSSPASSPITAPPASITTSPTTSRAAEPAAQANSARTYTDFTIDAQTLLDESDDEPRTQIVAGLLGEGAVILAGRPKYGKSFLAFNLSLAVAAGGRALGERAVNGGDVLHLLLEDGRKRGKKRLRDLLGHEGPIRRLTLAFEWLRLDDGGIELIERWCADHPARRLIVIDTLKRVRPPEKGNGRLYDLDYDAVAGLADLAKRWRVAVVAVHHTRKSDAEDVFDTVSGSTGLTGAVDGVWVLRRVPGHGAATLHVRDRDDEDRELGLEFSLDAEPYGWRICGSAEDVRMSAERARVLNILRNTTQALRPAELSVTLGRNADAVRAILFRMAEAGLVMKVGTGYRPADTLPTPTNTHVRNESNARNGGNESNGRNAAGLFVSQPDTSVTHVTHVTHNTQISRETAAEPCHYCKQPAPVAAVHNGRVVCPGCQWREDSE